MGDDTLGYFRVYYKEKEAPESVTPYIAWVRAADKADAKRIMEENLDLRTHKVVDVTTGARHMITRQSIVINCHDVVLELEKNMLF